MVKKTWIIAWTLLFVSVAGFADSPSPGPVPDEVLAAILGEPLAGASCATQGGGARSATVQGEKGLCTVDCGNGTSAQTNCNGTCTSVDRNCAILEPGHVTCNGVIVDTCTPGCCTGGGPIGIACCRCDALGGCFDCCRCAGGTISECSMIC